MSEEFEKRLRDELTAIGIELDRHSTVDKEFPLPIRVKELVNRYDDLGKFLEQANESERVTMTELSNAQALITRLRSELASAINGQSCGHAFKFIVSSDEGTQYCQRCESKGDDTRLRMELSKARAAIERKDAALRCSLDYQHGIDQKMMSGLGDSPLTAMIRAALEPQKAEQ